jgi:hypothetical protein
MKFTVKNQENYSRGELLLRSIFGPLYITLPHMFFDLIGNSPPRIYHSKEGKVEIIWDENFVLNFQEAFELK